MSPRSRQAPRGTDKQTSRQARTDSLAKWGGDSQLVPEPRSRPDTHRPGITCSPRERGRGATQPRCTHFLPRAQSRSGLPALSAVSSRCGRTVWQALHPTLRACSVSHLAVGTSHLCSLSGQRIHATPEGTWEPSVAFPEAQAGRPSPRVQLTCPRPLFSLVIAPLGRTHRSQGNGCRSGSGADSSGGARPAALEPGSQESRLSPWHAGPAGPRGHLRTDQGHP